MNDKIAAWIARHLPYNVKYWVIILAWARATTGEWSDEECPSVTTEKLLERLK